MMFLKTGALRTKRENEKMIRVCVVALLTSFLVVAQTSRADTVAGASPPLTDVGIASAWRTLRAVNCARCHGKDYDGLVAPSIINYARETNREMFVRKVLDGDPLRGMPGYGGNPLIAENIDGIYRYFMGRADGSFSSLSRSQ
jgi:cytochrome c55X